MINYPHLQAIYSLIHVMCDNCRGVKPVVHNNKHSLQIVCSCCSLDTFWRCQEVVFNWKADLTVTEDRSEFVVSVYKVI